MLAGLLVDSLGMSISRDAQFQPVEHAAGKVMDGELVVINFHSGLYYSSLGVGTVIWQLMEAGQSLEVMAATIARSRKCRDAGLVELRGRRTPWSQLSLRP